MKIKDKIKEIAGENQEVIDKILEINQIASFLNFIEEGVREFGDEDITNSFENLQELIMKTRKELFEREAR